MKYRNLHGYKYELMAQICVDIEIIALPNYSHKYIKFGDGVMYILNGYAWDGASGPTWDDKTNMRGSLVHDALYQLMRERYLPRSYRKYADELLRDICIEDGMNKLRAKAWYLTVRMFGGRSAKPEKNPRGQIIEIKPLIGELK